MGSPIACIVMEELRQLGIKVFLRIGTTMVLPPHETGAFYISKDAIPIEGTSKSYIPEGLIPKADEKMVEQISAAAANDNPPEPSVDKNSPEDPPVIVNCAAVPEIVLPLAIAVAAPAFPPISSTSNLLIYTIVQVASVPIVICAPAATPTGPPETAL